MPGSRVALGLVLGAVTPFMKNMYNDFSADLHADDSCIGCRRCSTFRPLVNISFDDAANKPTWGSECVNCMGCVNRCPKNAIQYKNKTQGKVRYVNPDYREVRYVADDRDDRGRVICHL